MEDKLRVIVTKIESSDLLESDKNHLYGIISLSLQETVMPILLRFMRKDKLLALANNPYKVTVDGYVDLIKETVKDGKALEEINQTMVEMLTEVEKALQEEGIN